MRDIALVAFVLAGLGFTLRYPFVGVLLWEWFSLMQPHEEAYGFSRSLFLNFAIASVTIGSWLMSKEPKKILMHPIIVLLGALLLWMTFNSFFAFNPDWSWQFWDRTWKIFLLGFMVAVLATNRVRVEALIWVAAVSLLYYGIKGGIFTVISGGQYKVFGPDNSIISDNNQLALALLMVIPLVEYLRTSTSSKILSWILFAAMALTSLSVIGSYSRGAYVAMAAIALLALLKARRKFLYIATLAIVLVPIYFLTPQSIFDRLATIQSADSDASFHGRVVAWQVAYRYATDHFPFGAGFYGPQLHGIFNAYFPEETAHAAHSIYFQILGEHGFIGLALYLAIAFISMGISWKISRIRQPDDKLWIEKMVNMIQISLVAFFVGGAALSMAYYDLFIVLICMLPQLSLLSSEGRKTKFSHPAFRVSVREAA